MTVYISGKITGLKNYRKIFKRAERKLTRMGYRVFNPCCIPVIFSDYEQYMRIDFVALEQCDCIYMLKNWKESQGARREFKHAVDLGKEVIYEE